LELAAKFAGHEIDFGCVKPVSREAEHYECRKQFGQSVCVGQTYTHSNMTKRECAAGCH
jgi:hypothetical protein